MRKAASIRIKPYTILSTERYAFFAEGTVKPNLTGPIFASSGV